MMIEAGGVHSEFDIISKNNVFIMLVSTLFCLEVNRKDKKEPP